MQKVENLEFKEKYRGHIKYIDKQFTVYQQTTKESFVRINNLLGDEKESQVEAFIEQSKPHSLTIYDSKEEITLKISFRILLQVSQVDK